MCEFFGLKKNKGKFNEREFFNSTCYLQTTEFNPHKSFGR